MIALWNWLGRLAYWLTWPALWLYLRGSHRTRVIIEYQDRIVVVKAWLGNGQWLLPGGGCHPNEAPAAAACREVLEETGLDIRPQQLRHLGSFQPRRRGFRYTYELFHVRLDGPPQLRATGGEIIAVALKNPADFRTGKTSGGLADNLSHWPT